MTIERRTFSAIEVLLVIGVLIILAVLLVPVLVKVESRGSRSKCANLLRQLGLAAIQYADDKRFYPHIRAVTALDGVQNTETPRKIRALVWFGYHDNPEGFICPRSFDTFYPMTNAAVVNDPRLWVWSGSGGGPAPMNASPIVDTKNDPSFPSTDELSYGWTIKGLNVGARSTMLLGADRSLREPGNEGAGAVNPIEIGNHPDGFNVVRTDGTVEFVPRDDPSSLSRGTSTDTASWLRSTVKDDGGFLDVFVRPAAGP